MPKRNAPEPKNKESKENLLKRYEIRFCYEISEERPPVTGEVDDRHKSATFIANGHIIANPPIEVQLYSMQLTDKEIQNKKTNKIEKHLAMLLDMKDENAKNANIHQLFDFDTVFDTHSILIFPKMFSTLDVYIKHRQTLELTGTAGNTSKNVPIPQMGTMVEQMLEAIIYLKERSIVHQAVCPKSIAVFYTNDNEPCNFKLTGFENARYTESSSSIFKHRNTEYLAPAAFLETEETHKTDLFALGITTIEVFVGTNVFKTKDPKLQMALYNELLQPDWATCKEVMEKCFGVKNVKRVPYSTRVAVTLSKDFRRDYNLLRIKYPVTFEELREYRSREFASGTQRPFVELLQSMIMWKEIDRTEPEDALESLRSLGLARSERAQPQNLVVQTSGRPDRPIATGQQGSSANDRAFSSQRITTQFELAQNVEVEGGSHSNVAGPSTHSRVAEQQRVQPPTSASQAFHSATDATSRYLKRVEWFCKENSATFQNQMTSRGIQNAIHAYRNAPATPQPTKRHVNKCSPNNCIIT